MSIRTPNLGQSPDLTTSDIQNELKQLVTALRASGIAGGRLLRGPEQGNTKLDGLVFAAGETRMLKHTLGRVPKGWFEVQKTMAANGGVVGLHADHVYPGVDLKAQFRVTATNAGTCYVYVF